MKFKEAVSNAHRIAEDIHNYAIKDELANLWNCIIDNIVPLREALDVIYKYCQEDKWIPTSKSLPIANKLVWVYSNSCGVDVCKIHPRRDGNWYSASDEFLYYGKDIIAWRPCLLPEPYIPEEEVKDGWHPVSEDPPKKESHYWVQLCGTDGNYAGMCECNWTDAGYVFPHTKTDWHWVNPQFTKVVAWRKLPDIYIEEEQ